MCSKLRMNKKKYLLGAHLQWQNQDTKVGDLSNNQLTGTIPESLGNLTFASGIYLSGNFLKGSIPASLGKLTYLRLLVISDVGDSHFQFLPSNMTRSLFTLMLRNCSISGQIPSDMGNMSSLSNLSFSNNMLSGKIPDWVQNATWSKMYVSIYCTSYLLCIEMPITFITLLTFSS
ncbi:putative non-specific serine/threonine protein kinase [Rosa chinensis]|uniref:Putative non-specific serine/threonine protein kinase n=1 Tax=Rosa chinensis TaxID=74649 RepID=A0A2P6Q270_ROSCH|nr:putative non-specific serine/threonine protein kinase [Rosa chinensis]